MIELRDCSVTVVMDKNMNSFYIFWCFTSDCSWTLIVLKWNSSGLKTRMPRKKKHVNVSQKCNATYSGTQSQILVSFSKGKYLSLCVIAIVALFSSSCWRAWVDYFVRDHWQYLSSNYPKWPWVVSDHDVSPPIWFFCDAAREMYQVACNLTI